MKPPADATPLYRLSWMGLRGLLNTFHRWEVYGAENVPMSGPFILAGNHASFYDPPVFGVGCPRALTYFARSTLFKGTVGKIIRAHNAVPVDRDSGDLAAFRTVFGILKGGGGLLVFPEGTRTNDGHLQSAKPGLGMIAARTGAPIVPARIHGSFRIFNRHMKVPDLDNRLI
ncbi:MAG: lysophospholipid acyltransferase family protein, partial [Verrucomicrobiota bacterium]